MCGKLCLPHIIRSDLRHKRTWRSGKPAIAEHKKEHDKLRAVVKDLYNMLEEEEGPSEAFVEQVNKNVIEWLYRHIKGFDRSVAEYKFMNESSERL